MPKLLIRLAALLLVPCMIADPVMANVGWSISDRGFKSQIPLPASQMYADQALMARLLSNRRLDRYGMVKQSFPRLLGTVALASRQRPGSTLMIAPGSWWGQLYTAAVIGPEAVRAWATDPANKDFLEYLRKQYPDTAQDIDSGNAFGVKIAVERKIAPHEETQLFFTHPLEAMFQTLKVTMPARETLESAAVDKMLHPLIEAMKLAHQMFHLKDRSDIKNSADAPLEHHALMNKIEKHVEKLRRGLIGHPSPNHPAFNLHFTATMQNMKRDHRLLNHTAAPGEELLIAAGAQPERIKPAETFGIEQGQFKPASGTTAKFADVPPGPGINSMATLSFQSEAKTESESHSVVRRQEMLKSLQEIQTGKFKPAESAAVFRDNPAISDSRLHGNATLSLRPGEENSGSINPNEKEAIRRELAQSLKAIQSSKSKKTNGEAGLSLILGAAGLGLMWLLNHLGGGSGVQQASLFGWPQILLTAVVGLALYPFRQKIKTPSLKDLQQFARAA